MKINDKIWSGPKEPYNKNILYWPDGESPNENELEYIDVSKKHFQDVDNQSTEDIQKMLLCVEAVLCKWNTQSLGVDGYAITPYPILLGTEYIDDIIAIAHTPRDWKGSAEILSNIFADPNRLNRLPRITKDEFYNI